MGLLISFPMNLNIKLSPGLGYDQLQSGPCSIYVPSPLGTHNHVLCKIYHPTKVKILKQKELICVPNWGCSNYGQLIAICLTVATASWVPFCPPWARDRPGASPCAAYDQESWSLGKAEHIMSSTLLVTQPASKDSSCTQSHNLPYPSVKWEPISAGSRAGSTPPGLQQTSLISQDPSNSFGQGTPPTEAASIEQQWEDSSHVFVLYSWSWRSRSLQLPNKAGQDNDKILSRLFPIFNHSD